MVSFWVGLPSVFALQWEATEIHLKAPINAASVTGVFNFTNDSDRDVTLTRVNASCGCTVPTLSKRTYAPGESGNIEVVFNIGSRQGLNRSSVTVHTDDPTQPIHSLMLTVDIPVAVQIQPRVVNWRVGELAEPKVIEITLHESSGQTLQGLLNTVEGFTTAIEAGDQPGVYRLTVTPVSTSERMRATFFLDLSPAPQRPVQAFAFIF